MENNYSKTSDNNNDNNNNESSSSNGGSDAALEGTLDGALNVGLEWVTYYSAL